MENINKDRQVTFCERICYGMGDASVNVFMGVTTMFLSIYYTDVFGLSPAFIGILFLVTRFIDAITDPWIGSLTDKYVGKLGRYRTWMKWSAIPYALSLVLVFWGPALTSEVARMVYASLTYLLLILCNACFSVPYISLNGVITSIPEERMEINGIRFLLATGSRLIVSIVIPILMAWFINPQDSYRVAMICIAILTLILAAFCIYGTNERVQNNDEHNSRLSLWQQAKAFLENDQAKIICIFLAVVNICYTLRLGGLAYYIKYYLKQSDYMLSVFLMVSSVAGMVSPAFSVWLAKRNILKVKGLLIVSQAAGGSLMILGFWLTKDYWLIAMVLTGLITFFIEFQSAIVWSSPGNCADYGQIKYGKNIRGALNGALMFFLKVGMAIGGALLGFILYFYGYDAEKEVSNHQINGFIFIVWVLPGVISLANVFLARCWVLTPEYMEKLRNKNI
ncbi:MFS transporter [Citrobacter telavivensis]